jgi:hypothetical protein
MSADRDDAGDELARVSDDAEEFIDKARLRSLFEARDEAAEAIRGSSLRTFEIRRRRDSDAAEAEIERAVDEHVRSAVTAYVLEAEPLLQNTSDGQNLWQDAGLAPVPLPDAPAAGWDSVPSRTVEGVPGRWVDEARGVIRLPGIAHFVNIETPFTVRWSGFADGAGLNRGSDYAEREAQMTLPQSTSEDVFRVLNKLLADLGIGIEAELDEDGEASYDYSDLI